MLANTNAKLKGEIISELRNSGVSFSIDNDMHELKENYTYKAQAYREILVSLQNIFEYSLQPFDSKALFNSFKEAYEGNEDFIIEMFDVLSLF
jgi:hypothetical protein